MIPLPKRPSSHVVGDDAVRLFSAACPSEWIVSPIAPDYGLDLRIEIVRESVLTGEEFLVQVKGKKHFVHDRRGTVSVPIRHSTLNYWLGKVQPIMVAAVETTKHRLWYGWLDQTYQEFPRPTRAEGELHLALKCRVADDFAATVAAHVAKHYAAFREDRLLTDRVQLSRFALHTAGIASALARMFVLSVSEQTPEDTKRQLEGLLLQFGIHDSFLLTLWESDSPWHQELTSRVAALVAPRLTDYLQLRGHFWMHEKRVTTGDVDLVPLSYSALGEYLLPALEAGWALQETINELLVLGSVQYSRSGA